jgi:hypothetical protein
LNEARPAAQRGGDQERILNDRAENNRCQESGEAAAKDAAERKTQVEGRQILRRRTRFIKARVTDGGRDEEEGEVKGEQPVGMYQPAENEHGGN